MILPGPALHPRRGGQEQKETEKGRDWGCGPQTQACNNSEQKHCPVKQGNKAS